MNKKIQELKKYIDSKVLPDDIFLAIAFGSQVCQVPSNSSILHASFYELKQKLRFKRLLTDFTFDMSGISPYSKTLEDVLFRLEFSEIIQQIPFLGDKYCLNTSFVLNDRVLGKFSESEQQLLTEASKELQDLFEKRT
ncbi:MAG: hypothetical protein ACOCQR_02495 [bacterium]